MTLTTRAGWCHLRPEVLDRDILDRREVGVSGVVDDDVEPSEFVQRGPYSRFGRVRVGDVECHDPDAIAVGRDQVVEIGGLARTSDELIAVLEDGAGDLPAEAAGCAGDEIDLGH